MAVAKAIEGPPTIGVRTHGPVTRVGEQVDLGSSRAQCDGLLLEIDLRALMVGVGQGADQQQASNALAAQRGDSAPSWDPGR
jgi:hypothetical protein